MKKGVRTIYRKPLGCNDTGEYQMTTKVEAYRSAYISGNRIDTPSL